ncbi:MAG: type III pantothenate kinase [Nannocystaceae bacterium]
MLLAIDVGNSNTSVGVFDGDERKCELRLSTRRNATRDEIAISLERALALSGLTFSDLEDAVLACVVPPVLGPWLQALSHYVHLDALVIEPGIRTGMPIRYDPPQDVGADRIVAAVAAHERYGKRPNDTVKHGIIVVDFGTATTFDVVSPRPDYLGGIIAPGIGISADALFARAAKLPRVDITRPDQVIGRNTMAAIQSGLVYGYVSLVEGLLARIRNELDWPSRVVGTGGFAAAVARDSDCIEFVDNALVLDGLRLIHSRNRTRAK